MPRLRRPLLRSEREVLRLGLDSLVGVLSILGGVLPRSSLSEANLPSYSILWTALFGLFGNVYIGSNPTPEQSDQRRMKNAVWVDLTNMLLWLITAIWGTVAFFRSRGGRTLHTGRAKV